MMFKSIITTVFGLSLFINAMLFVPQLIKVFRAKKAEDLSGVTFFGFCLIQIASIAYGLINEDNIMVVGYGLSFLLCGTLTILIIKYNSFN